MLPPPDRSESFLKALQERYGLGPRKVRWNAGASNSARFIEDGLQLGVTNLERFDGAIDEPFVVGAMLRFGPRQEVYIGIKVQSGRKAMAKRLAHMSSSAPNTGDSGNQDNGQAAAEGQAEAMPVSAAQATLALPTDTLPLAADEEDAGTQVLQDTDTETGTAAMADVQLLLGQAPLIYAKRNNNTVIYLAQDGKLYLRNKDFWHSLRNVDLHSIGPGIPVDEVVVAVWPPAAVVPRTLVAGEFIGYLARLFPRDRIHEIHPWGTERELPETMRRKPSALDIKDIRQAIEAMGGYYPNGEIEHLHAGLNFLEDKHFVVLPGLSGTGKTRLVSLYARAVHGIRKAADPDPLLFTVPVRPEWTDPSGLLGYFDVLANRYQVPVFLEAVLAANAHPFSPVFVLLDEMNLARVEYYFADVLSCLESGEWLQLHASDVPLEGSNGVTVDKRLALPSNLYIVGTINVDETTNALSDKVLDRATVIGMTAVDIPGYLDRLASDDPALAVPVARCRPVLEAVHAALSANGLGFGYRVAREVVHYHAFAAGRMGQDETTVLDALMAQKVLVKLRGSERQRQMLGTLQDVLAGLPRSLELVGALERELDELGSFQASR
jgi:hypothetical protein